MAIPTYTGGTGIKAPRISPGLRGNKAGAWLALAGGALKAASGFDFIWKSRADEKRAASTAAMNRLTLAHNAQIRDLARDAIDDPVAYADGSDTMLKAQLAEWDRAREADEISVEDHARGTGALMTRQARFQSQIDKRYLARSDERKVEEAELAAAEAVGNPMAIGAGLASADGRENGIAANQIAEAEAAIMDPNGPFASMGPAAQQLHLNDFKREISQAAITSRIMRVHGQGGDVGPMVAELRQRTGLRDGVWGFEMPNGLRVGTLLGGDTLDSMADAIEADIARLDRQKVTDSNAAADADTDGEAVRAMGLVDALRENRIDQQTFMALAPASGFTTAGALAELGRTGEPSTAQRAFEESIRPVFDEWLAETDAKVRVSRNAQPYHDRIMELGALERTGQVSEDWATARRSTLRGRIDRISMEAEGTLSLTDSEAAVMDRVRDTVGSRTSSAPGAKGIYADRMEQFAHPTMPVQKLGGPGYYEGDFMGDMVRANAIVAASQQALDQGVPHQVVETLAAISLHAGGNGDWVKYATVHGVGDGGVQGAQELWQKAPRQALRSFPHMQANADKLRYGDDGAIDVIATQNDIVDNAIVRARAAKPKNRFLSQGPVELSEQDIVEALTPKDLYTIGFTESLSQFLAMTPPVPERVQSGRIDTLSKRLAAERKMAEAQQEE